MSIPNMSDSHGVRCVMEWTGRDQNIKYGPNNTWKCPNTRRGFAHDECFSPRQKPDPDEDPEANISQDQKNSRALMALQAHNTKRYLDSNESYEDLKKRLLMQGQRKLQSQGQYLLTHMGLNTNQVKTWKESDRLRYSSRPVSVSHDNLFRPATGMSRASSVSSLPPRKHVPQDPVIEVMMKGPPAFSPTLAGMAQGALA
mmetsp:Transcript_12380/g.21978  ORF Transcript_12380/g.21978 Transcript_12380/m.21978 type:complete len:200 (-) Transcript_12380:157-756(-)